MRWCILFAFVAPVLMPSGALIATPTVRLAVPSPGQYGIEQLWRVTLNNPDSKTYEVWLEGTITEAAKGQVFWAKTNKFQLPPGTKVIRYADIESIGIDQQTYVPGYKDFAARTGGLLEGDYTFTVKLMPDFGSKTVKFRVEPTSPPRLIMPRDGDTVTVKYPHFIWTPPVPALRGGVTYNLELFEVMPGQSPDEALRANRPWFTKSGIEATSFTYPTSAPALPESGRYVWQVTLHSGPVGPGKSASATFTLFKIGVPQPKINLTMDAVIVWQHQNLAGLNWEIWYADFSSGASRVFTPQPLYTTPGNNMDPAVAYDRGGNTWVVWSHYDIGSSQYRIFWSRRKSGQTAWSAPAAITLPTGSHQMDPAIAFDDNGKGFCVWVEGNITTTNDLTILQVSFWDGSNWLTPASKGPGVTGTGRLPEITFTGAPAYGPGNPKTSHAAVVIAALQDPPDKMGWWAWNGSGWSGCNVLPTTGGVVTHSYTGYLDPTAPMPAQDHVTIATIPCWFGDLGYPVTAAWTRQFASAGTKLMACNGYFNGANWTWWEYPGWLWGAGLVARDPAVAVDGSYESHYVYISAGNVYCTRYGCSCELLVPPANGNPGVRPAIAWVGGPKPRMLAAWYDLNDSEIHWSSRNTANWNWTQPAALVVPGLDFNPDIAAKSGSHTMLVK